MTTTSTGRKLPDITPAQIAAVITFVIGQLVSLGLLDSETSKIVLSSAVTLLPVAWVIGDSILRHGRAPIAVAEIEAATAPKMGTRITP